MDLKYELKKDGILPLYIQLYNCIRDDIMSGRIEDGVRLPSRRKLCVDMQISKNTVDVAYQKLVDDGYLISKPRSGFYARRNSPVNTNIDEPDYYNKDGILYTMSHNGMDISAIPSDALAKLYREITFDEPELFGFGHKFGEKILRQAINKYLYNDMGISCGSSQIIIGAGTDYIIEQLCHIFDERALAAFENPCFARSYMPVKNSTLKSCLIDTKYNDFDFEEFEKSGANILYLITAHQFPLGYSISDSTREKLLNWLAEKPERYIIEEDNDMCFWEEKPFVPLFKSDTSGRVIFIGSFRSTLSPAIKTAYAVLPRELKARFNERLPYYTSLASRIEQRVIAEYILSGKYERQLKKLRQIYTAKRRRLISEVNSALGDKVKLLGENCGTFIPASVDSKLNEQQLRKMAADVGVKFISVADCCITVNEKLPRNTFIFGFGDMTETEISEAVKRIAAAWENC